MPLKIESELSIVLIHLPYLPQICRKRRLKGGLERKLMLLFCVGSVHTNLYNCFS